MNGIVYQVWTRKVQFERVFSFFI